jgi:hypothetical protein
LRRKGREEPVDNGRREREKGEYAEAISGETDQLHALGNVGGTAERPDATHASSPSNAGQTASGSPSGAVAYR